MVELRQRAHGELNSGRPMCHGGQTYTWTASAPAVWPVFLTRTLTSAPPSLVERTLRLEKPNVV